MGYKMDIIQIIAIGWERFLTFASTFFDTGLLITALVLFVIATCLRPEKWPKEVNQPIAALLVGVLGLYILLRSALFLQSSTFGFSEIDARIISLIVLSIGLVSLWNLYTAKGKIILIVAVLILFFGAVVMGLTGPANSPVSNFIRIVIPFGQTLFGSIGT